MILYHAVSTYQLLFCIVHRLQKNKESQCDILLSDYIKDKFPYYKQLKAFFNNIYCFSNTELSKEVVDIVPHTIKYFDSFLRENYLNINTYKDIYVGCAHNYFGIYLVSKGIKFTFVEDASGLLSRPEIIEQIEEKLFLKKHQICKQMGLYDGSNKYIVKKICNLNTQVDGFQDDKVEHFDVVEAINSLDEEQKQALNNFFGINNKINNDGSAILLLTQHFANLKILTLEEQKEIYRILVDYFVGKNKLVIKPHPDDLLYYDKMFPEALVIKEKFPSELIPSVLNQRPACILTVTSTAINNLKNMYTCISFSHFFEKNFKIIHKYYCALKIAIELKDPDLIYELYTDKILISNLIRYTELNKDITLKEISLDIFNKKELQGGVYIVDDIESNELDDPSKVNELLKAIDNDSVVIFINSLGKHIYYDYPNKELLKYFVPLELNLTSFNERYESWESTFDVFYLFSKNEDLRQKASNIHFVKRLKNSNINISVEALPPERRKILLLQGILSATEQRLMRYIELEAELSKKLNEVY